MSKAGTLFEPLTLGGVTIPNRIFHAAMSTRLVNDGLMHADFIGYHEARAQGGTGVLVTEALSVCPSTAAPSRVQLRDSRNIPMLEDLATRVHGAGAMVLGQLWHNGNARHNGRSSEALGISSRPDDLSLTVARLMSTADLDGMVQRFADAAVRLQDAGLDGAELAGAHGFLIHQTLSPHANDRSDDYGGSRQKRIAFVRKIIAAIRARCGPGFIVGLKMPWDEAVDGGLDLDEADAICQILTAAEPPDYYCFSRGSHSRSLEMHLPAVGEPQVGFADALGRLRPAVGDVPIVAVGKLTGIGETARLVETGIADAVALGRALVADPALPAKARAGQVDDITPCIACNLCWGEINRGRTLACAVNPSVLGPSNADESGRASQSQVVDIAGSGIAAMEMAWRLASRGHDVRLIARRNTLGGALALLAPIPTTGELERYLDYLRGRLSRTGVAVVHSGDATMPRPGAVTVNAAGSSLSAPTDRNGANVSSTSIRDVLRDLGTNAERGGDHVVLYDNDHTEGTYLATTWLAKRFARLTIVTPRPMVASDVNVINAQKIHRWIQTNGHAVVPFCELVDCDGKKAVVRNVYSGHLQEVTADLTVHSTPRVQNDLPPPWGAADFVIADAAAPRDILAAVADAERLAVRLSEPQSVTNDRIA